MKNPPKGSTSAAGHSSEESELSSRLDWTLWVLVLIFIAGFSLAVRGASRDGNSLQEQHKSDPYDVTANATDQSSHTRLETGF